MIIRLQRAWGDNATLQWFMRLPLILVRPQVTCLFMCLLYLASDSLIAFKVSHLLANWVERDSDLLWFLSDHFLEVAL